MNYRIIIVLFLVVSTLPAISQGVFNINEQSIEYSMEVKVKGLKHPWDFSFLPNNEILITERGGHLRVFKDGNLSKPIMGLPEVFANSQGGLFDVELHPQFSENKIIFLSYAHGSIESNTLRVVRAKYKNNRLSDIRILFEVEPYKDTPVHYGGRLLALPDSSLLITTGDGFDYREKAQLLNNSMGKVLRIYFDGSIPGNNPFLNDPQKVKAIWTYGHRNPQGLIYDSVRKKVFLHEHGPKGGDEINLVTAGNNYGWPLTSYGKDYFGAQITPFEQYEGVTEPLLYWKSAIAPSGMAAYYGEQFPELEGDLLVGSLVKKEVRLIKMNGLNVVEQMPLFSELKARVRAIKISLDGSIYVLTDEENGKLVEIRRRKK
ncbi:PQQ-dependent sugar dehydrogenase [Pleionea sediminis]|uniref:PQQ-dependent sugar dehydrogenase n=1 Tax=Pleionea sediminis TaxID=2569479 RepID=UPI001184D87E|nr:PQQ-dependent sugar dehydrogenase [Pleionea sediminis]